MIPLRNKFLQSCLRLQLVTLFSLVCIVSFSTLEVSAQEETIEEYSLKVRSDPNILFIQGSGFYQSGTIVTLDAPEHWQEYTFVGWKVNGMWAEGNPLKISMDRSHEAIAVFEKGVVGSIIIDAIPRISEITIDGTIYLPDELPVTFDWDEGTIHVITVPAIIQEGPETRYVFDSWKDKNIEHVRTVTFDSENKEFIALFKTQHYLKAITEYGKVIGGGWHEEGKTANFELETDIVIDKKDDNVRYVFESWDVGDYPNSQSNTVDIVNPSTVRAKWTPQYKLDLRTSIPGYDLFGTGWYEKEKQVALIAEEELESSNSDIRYVFDKWVSKGPNPVIIPNAHAPSTTIKVVQPYVIEATYKESFRVNVWSQYGNPIGADFYKAGDIAEIKLDQNTIVVSPNKERKVFTGWNTFGARTMNPQDEKVLAGSSAAQNLLVFVDRPLNVTTNWKTQYYLDLQSQEGSVKGRGWYDLGRMVPFSIDKTNTPPGMWSVKVFDKWTGDVESTQTRERVIMNSPKTVIAEWETNNSPGIINAIILGGVAAIGGVVYLKTHKKANIDSKIPKLKKQSFEKFFALKGGQTDNSPSFYQKPKRNILGWLLGRE